MKVLRTINLFFGKIGSWIIKGYQVFLSPLIPPSCRFYPTCSEYGRISFLRHGLIRGTYLTAHRIIRCNPWNHGGYDPVPPLPGDEEDKPDAYKKKGDQEHINHIHERKPVEASDSANIDSVVSGE